MIEQFTYLLFIKQLDETETIRENEASFLGIEYQGIFTEECQKYRWSRFKNLGDAQEIYDMFLNGVFPFIKNLHGDGESAYSKYMGDAIFKIPTPAMLTKLIDGSMDWNWEKRTVKEICMSIFSQKLQQQEQTGSSVRPGTL